MPATVYTHGTVNADGSDLPNFSFRQFGTLLGPIRGRLRATFQAAASGGFALDHASFGYTTGNIATSSLLNAVPLELLFGGASGFSIAANAQITSDWLNFTTINLAAGAHWSITGDLPATSSKGLTYLPVSDEIVYIGTGDGYNTASDAIYTGGSFGLNVSIVSIESAFGMVWQRRRKLYTPRRWL